jgi:hypothetical protein
VDAFLGNLVAKDTPQINSIIANGIACTHMTQTEMYVDQVFRAASKGFPEGLTYTGCKRCTPHEEFAIVTRKKGTKRIYNVARSDIYMMKYFFNYKGIDLEPRYMYLPFVSDGGHITISGSRFTISPILSDRVISVGMSDIFVRLLRDRLTFKRTGYHYMVDGKRETVQVSWSLIYHKNSKMKKLRPTVKANCTLMHYLLCKYGFTDTFLKFGNCNPVIGGIEINKDTHPETDWVICSSTQVKPKGCMRGFYEPSIIRIAIRKDEMTPIVRNMLGGFFYVVDHFPSRIKPTLEYVNSQRLWKILLGNIIFSGSINEGKLHDDINDHIVSLDEYLDSLVILKLKDIGIHVEDIYQLFAVIIEHFNDWLLGSTDKVSSMYDKELSVLYYVLYDITSAIFRLYFKLKAASKKDLTAKEITTMMNLSLRQGTIFSITRNHNEISTISTSGDNKAFKTTAILVPQTSSTNISSRKDRAIVNDPQKRLHVSVAEVGSFANLPKSEPSGRSRINPCLQIDSKGVVLRDPRFIELLDSVQQIIKR